jgi:hypothetical protein
MSVTVRCSYKLYDDMVLAVLLWFHLSYQVGDKY